MHSARASSEVDFAAVTSGEPCPAGVYPTPFLNLPTSCAGPLETRYRADSWVNPGVWLEGSFLTHDHGEPPTPRASPAAANCLEPDPTTGQLITTADNLP